VNQPRPILSSSATQLALGVRLAANRRLDNFIAGDNTQALQTIIEYVNGAQTGHLYLQGARGTGKSHLLQGACAEMAARGVQVSYIPLTERAELKVQILASLAHCELICVDDIDEIASDSEWQRAIFNLYNEMEGTRTRIIFSAQHEPTCLSLADLASRLQAALRVIINPATDISRAQVLAQRAQAFGFDLDDDAIRYILQHHSRDMHHLVALLDDLDAFSLAAKQRVSLSLLRKFLRQRDADRDCSR